VDLQCGSLSFASCASCASHAFTRNSSSSPTFCLQLCAPAFLTALCAPSTCLLLSSSVFLRLRNSALLPTRLLLLLTPPRPFGAASLHLATSPPLHICTASTHPPAIGATFAFSPSLPWLHSIDSRLGAIPCFCLQTRIERILATVDSSHDGRLLVVLGIA